MAIRTRAATTRCRYIVGPDRSGSGSNRYAQASFENSALDGIEGTKSVCHSAIEVGVAEYITHLLFAGAPRREPRSQRLCVFPCDIDDVDVGESCRSQEPRVGGAHGRLRRSSGVRDPPLSRREALGWMDCPEADASAPLECPAVRSQHGELGGESTENVAVDNCVENRRSKWQFVARARCSRVAFSDTI